MNRLTINLTLVVFFLCILPLSGQTKKELKEKFYEGEMFLLYEEYNEAIPFYEELLSIFPDNANYKYRLGICYLNMPGQKEQSLGYLQDAIQHINPKYREGNFKEEGADYDAWYFLAKAYLITNQIDKAIETYNRFYEGMDHKLYDSTLVKKEIEACHNAQRLIKVPLYLKSVNQGGIINDRFSEVNPVVSADENTMVYTREAQLQDMIVFTRKVDGEWTPGVVIMDQLLVDEGYSTSITGDGNELYLYKNDQYVGNIYSSRFVDGRWLPAVKLNENINTKYWESHAAVSSDGSRLFFTSNRIEGGYGGLDIYMSERDSTGDWGPAVNLGPTINTPFNEETPFLDKTDKVLFFSSRGHFGMGGHDIFYSTKLENGKWAIPINMGYPVNSTDDDTFFHPVGEGYTAYVSIFDKNGFGLKDIHRVEIFSDDHPRKFFVRGMVTLRDLISQFTDSVKISTLNKENLDTLLIVYSDPSTGEYEFEIPQGDYQIVYESDGSEKIVSDLTLDLIHPTDSINVAETELVKSDLVADISIVNDDSLAVLIAGDTSNIDVSVEPNSILLVEHWQGDSLISSDVYIINDTLFTYPMQALTGDNNFKFKVTDRFGNTTIKELNVRGEKPVQISPIEVIEPEKLIAEVRDSAVIDQKVKIDSAIDNMDQRIKEVSEVSENDQIKGALEKTKEKNIKNAGEWLESIYSVAIEDGAKEDLLTRLIAALSANKDENAEDYLARIKEYAGDNLRRAIEAFDLSEINANNPEDIIKYLLNNAEEFGYTQQELFESFAKLIDSDKKTAEEIVDYIESLESNNLWIIWLMLGAGAFIFFIFWRRKKNKENDKH